MNIQKIQPKIFNILCFKSNKNIDKKTENNTNIDNQTFVRNFAVENELVLRTEDNSYRANLLRTIGASKYFQCKIQSIMGPNETRKILKELDTSEQNFVASPENIETGKFRANLHIHTIASDGYYSPKELLKDSAEYADNVYKKTGKPFVIAITDHDTIDSHQEIIKEIYENSEKYKNLKVILGMESTTYEDVKGKPIQFHMLVYNIDSSDKKFVNFVENQKEKKKELSKFVIDNINNSYNNIFKKGNLLSYEEYANMYPPMKKGVISPHNYIRNYAMTKFLVSEILPNTEILKDYFDEINPTRNPDIEMKKIKDFQYETTHNNRAFTALAGVTDYYSKLVGVDSDILAKEIKEKANNSDRIMTFIKNVNGKLYNHRNINGKNFYVNISEICEALSNQPKVTLGIAHPLSTTIDNPNYDPFVNVIYKPKKSNSVSYNKTEEFIVDFYNKFKEQGQDRAKFSERYYQSYSTKKSDIQTPSNMQECIDKLSLENDMLRTGGYDSHRKTIFSRY